MMRGSPSVNTFYEAWRWIIQRYGIFNPYTGRGAIPGLLPHGPHSVRDVLATHVLKQTGSYEQASYAIQDTPEKSPSTTASSSHRTKPPWQRRSSTELGRRHDEVSKVSGGTLESPASRWHFDT